MVKYLNCREWLFSDRLLNINVSHGEFLCLEKKKNALTKLKMNVCVCHHYRRRQHRDCRLKKIFLCRVIFVESKHMMYTCVLCITVKNVYI